MLKSYDELVQVDVLPHCDYRETRDDQGNKIKVPYLNWAKCIQLLHEHGAQSVFFEPVKAPGGGYLLSSRDVEDKDGRKTGCWFVGVKIHIDKQTFTQESPLLNGSYVVYEENLNQARIANAHARAFVKGVAIHTGLGFKLWSETRDTDEQDDLSGHSIFAIKRRIEEQITRKLQDGMELTELYGLVDLSRRQFDTLMAQFNNIALLEEKLKAL